MEHVDIELFINKNMYIKTIWNFQSGNKIYNAETTEKELIPYLESLANEFTTKVKERPKGVILLDYPVIETKEMGFRSMVTKKGYVDIELFINKYKWDIIGEPHFDLVLEGKLNPQRKH